MRTSTNKPPSYQSLAEIEAAALARLPPMVVGYYASGAEDQATLADNLASWRRHRILPRVMVDVSKVDTRMQLFGHWLTAPILVAPMAMMAMAHPTGEAGMAAGCAAAGLPMVVSTMGTVSLEDVASSARAVNAGLPLLFQLYVTRDRAFTAGLVRRAQAAGYAAIVVTVDVPVVGKREADERTGFALPPGLRLANLEGLAADGSSGDRGGATAGESGAASTSTSPPSATAAAAQGSRLAAMLRIDPSLTWEFVGWLKGVTSLPVWVKGVLSPDDALAAAAAGASGVVVSNHGGRQLDGAPAAADCVRPIAAALRRRIPVLVDGGVRRGADVLRALALGADGVLVGRPILYALAMGGAGGVEGALGLLVGELQRAMALAGCPTLDHARRVVLLGPGEEPALSSRL